MFKLSRVIAAMATVTAGSALLCGSAWAATSAKIDYSLTFTTQMPGSPSGAVERVVFTNRDDPNAKPPAPGHILLRLAPGGRIDTGAVDRCGASDPELMAMGPSACPASSRVGTDTLELDTGFPANRYLTADLVFFNADHQLIILGRDRQTGAYVVTRAKVTKDSADIPFPQLPGTPPDGAAIKREHAILYTATSRRGGRMRSYITTPPGCPAGGHWTLSTTYTYRDGSKQTVRSASPCVRNAKPALHVAMFRRQSADAGEPFTVRVHASRAARATATIRVGDRTLAKRTVGLHAGSNGIGFRALAAGDYRLIVTARTDDGSRATTSARLAVR